MSCAVAITSPKTNSSCASILDDLRDAVAAAQEVPRGLPAPRAAGRGDQRPETRRKRQRGAGAVPKPPHPVPRPRLAAVIAAPSAPVVPPTAPVARSGRAQSQPASVRRRSRSRARVVEQTRWAALCAEVSPLVSSGSEEQSPPRRPLRRLLAPIRREMTQTSPALPVVKARTGAEVAGAPSRLPRPPEVHTVTPCARGSCHCGPY